RFCGLSLCSACGSRQGHRRQQGAHVDLCAAAGAHTHAVDREFSCVFEKQITSHPDVPVPFLTPLTGPVSVSKTQDLCKKNHYWYIEWLVSQLTITHRVLGGLCSAAKKKIKPCVDVKARLQPSYKSPVFRPFCYNKKRL
uniref:Uncharacterized protein n=1 Tax=Crocodylus porosus TaxID=8502 RepID=A0A7M4FG15_CROPO